MQITASVRSGLVQLVYKNGKTVLIHPKSMVFAWFALMVIFFTNICVFSGLCNKNN
jgi:hypothetical protein